MLIKVDNIGMVNILAGSEICPELVQHHATPQSIASAMIPLLKDTETRQKMLKDLEQVKESLGSGNASCNAAEIVINSLDR